MSKLKFRQPMLCCKDPRCVHTLPQPLAKLMGTLTLRRRDAVQRLRERSHCVNTEEEAEKALM